MNRLSVITDELDDDLDLALAICHRMGVADVELRTIRGRNWLSIDEAELARVVTDVRDRGFGVVALASAIFKCPLPGAGARAGAALHGASGTATLDDHWELLEQALHRAAAVEVPLIRIFSCWRVPEPADALDDVVEIIAEAERRAAPFPVEVALENEHDCNIATATETQELLGRLPGLRVIWDPGNHVRGGGPPSESALDGHIDRIAHMHLKDVGDNGSWVQLGQGVVPFDEVVGRALAEGYEGAFSLETHCELNGSRVAATEAGVVTLRSLLGRAR